MPAKRPGRDPRFTRTVGTPPHAGRRYVENGRVRIEWTEDGRRRRRTIGGNDAATRARADGVLAATIARLTGAKEAPMPDEHEGQREEATVPSLLRGAALAAMRAADELVEWFRHPPEDDPGATATPDTPPEEPADEGDR